MKSIEIKDPKIKKYVQKLEKELECYKSSETTNASYRALKSYIDKYNQSLSAHDIDPKMLSDKDDKFADRITKFANDVLDLNEKLKKMEVMILPKDKDLGKRKSASDYEDMLNE